MGVIAGVNTADAIRNISTGALTGLHNPLYPMIINLGSLWCIGFPASIALSLTMENKILGIALGQGIGILTGALFDGMGWVYKSWNPKISDNRYTMFAKENIVVNEEKGETSLLLNKSTTPQSKRSSKYCGCGIM